MRVVGLDDDVVHADRVLEEAALVDTVMALQQLAVEVGDDISELDINPIMVLPAGRGVVAVDALVIAR